MTRGHDRHRLAPATHRRPALPLAAQTRRRGALALVRLRFGLGLLRLLGLLPRGGLRGGGPALGGRLLSVRVRGLRGLARRLGLAPASSAARTATAGPGLGSGRSVHRSRSGVPSGVPPGSGRPATRATVSVPGSASVVTVSLEDAVPAEPDPPRPRPRPPRERRRVPAGRGPVSARSTSPGWASRSTSGCSSAFAAARCLGARELRVGGVSPSDEVGAFVVAPAILGRRAVAGRRAGAGAGARAPAPAATSAAAPPAPASTRTRRGASAPAGPGARRATIGGTRRLDRFGDLRPGGSRTRVVVHRRSLRLGRGDGGARRGDGVGRVRTPGWASGRDGLAGRPGLIGWTHGPGDVVPLTLRRFVAHAESPVLGGLFRPRPSGFGPGAGVAGASPLLTSPVPRGPMAATRRANLVPRIPDADGPERHLGQERWSVPGPARAC